MRSARSRGRAGGMEGSELDGGTELVSARWKGRRGSAQQASSTESHTTCFPKISESRKVKAAERGLEKRRCGDLPLLPGTCWEGQRRRRREETTPERYLLKASRRDAIGSSEAIGSSSAEGRKRKKSASRQRGVTRFISIVIGQSLSEAKFSPPRYDVTDLRVQHL